MGDGSWGQGVSYGWQGSGYRSPKRFSVEGMRMRVRGRWYQAFSWGGDGNSRSTATGRLLQLGYGNWQGKGD
uniref:Uncharacterized protein n=1 Tax=Romanomermis culicivorax TaxID=13658 RepID=A0A915JLA6_ROMCU